MSKFEVQEWCLCGGWTNTWSMNDVAMTFDTKDAADIHLNWFLEDMAMEVAEGNMADVPDRDTFRIVEVKED